MVRVGILLLGLLLTLASMAHSLPFGGVFFRLLDGAATTTVPYGSTVSMKGVFANGTGLIKDQDLATTFDPVVSGTTYTTLPLTSSKTYTLTVSNPAGDSVTAHVDVTVTPISVGVTPTSASVTLNTPKPFTATVTNCAASVAKTVTWTVDGVPNGNSTVGTITADGVYTAPVTMTAPPGHTIRAISTVDTSQSGSASVTLVAAPTTPTISAPANVTAATGGYAASVSTQAGSTYAWTITNGTINTGADTNAITFTAGASGTVDLSCIVTNLAGTPSTAGTFSSSIVAAPVATSLTASNTTPTSGATFTLTPVYSAGTGTLTYAGGSVTCPATGAESAAITANWTGARTYTLTVTNALGAVATRTVTVTPAAPFVITAFTPNLPLVSYGGGATLSWALSGSAPTTLTLDGASVLGNLSALVAPRNRQTYTLTGTDGLNTSTQTLKVGAQGLDLLAGSPGGFGTADGSGTVARFSWPGGVAVDGAGNTYVADTLSHTIRKITPSGGVSTLAGQAGSPGSADGTGTEAQFYEPSGVAVDTAGIVYVADGANNTIRKITALGEVSTLAGLASGLASNIDATGRDARFNYPTGVAVDAVGNVYVADLGNNTIRKITPLGVVTTLAGSNTAGFLNGSGTAARFQAPWGVAVDKDGNVYVADSYSNAIRKVTSLGVVTTLAGQATSGSADAKGTAAQFYQPSGVAVDPAGISVYVADTVNGTIRKITLSTGEVTSLAGSAGSSGSADGTGTNARFDFPRGLAVDAAGNVYVADTGNGIIRKITLSAGVGEVSTLAGRAAVTGTSISTVGVAVDATGNAYVADSANHTIRKITPAGGVSTLAGSGTAGWTVDGTIGTAAQFRSPRGVAGDATGTAVYVADAGNHAIRKIILASGEVSTLAGSAGAMATGTTNATGTAARFNAPQGVAVDKDGNVYVADTGNNTIRKITISAGVGTVTTLTGAVFSGPSGVAVDQDLNVYVASTNNHTIYTITPGGVVSTLAGLPGTSGHNDDPTGTNARFNSPTGVAVDADKNVYVTDSGNHTIRKITSGGAVTTVAGRAGVASFQAGPLPGLLSSPQGLALTADGDLVITMSNAVVQVTAPGAALAEPSLAASSSTVPRGATFTLTPTFATGTGNIDQGVGAVSSGTPVTVTANWTGARTFTLTVTYTNGTTATALATVTPQVVTVGSISPAATTVTASTPTPFSATVTGGNLGTLTWSSTGGGIWSGSTWTAPATAGGPYTITATSVEDPTQSATTTVTVVAPTAASLTASALTPVFGATFTLTPVYSDGVASLTYSGPGASSGSVTCPATGASAALTASWAGARTYTLTVTNAAGSVATAAVTMKPNAFAIDAFTANRSLVSYGGSATLSWTLSGPAPTALTLDGASVLGNLSALVAPRNRETYTLFGTSGNTDTQTLRVAAQGLDLLSGDRLLTGSANGTGAAARFSGPWGVAVDAAGNAYVADSANHTLRKITPAGVVSTLAGMAGTSGWTADGTIGIAAKFNSPKGVALDALGNLYVADTTNHRIRKIILSSGAVSTLAGSGTAGAGNAPPGPATNAQFSSPQGVAVDAAGNVYVADTGNHILRKITPAGVVSTLAGRAGTAAYLDSPNSATSARFNAPLGVVVDADGHVYVADTGNHAIRKITPAGEVTTLAGYGTRSGFADGTGTAAQFNTPSAVVLDATGNLYVADTGNHTLRKITSLGVVTTVAGRTGVQGFQPGPLPGGLSSPQGLALTPDGDLVISTGNAIAQATAPTAAPAEPALAASSSTVARGASFTLTPTFSAGTGVIDQSVGSVSTGTAKPVMADWTGARTFTLTVTYTDGTTATAPVTVTPLVVSVGAITPAAATVTAGTSTAFSTTVTGGNLGTVTWSSTAGSWSGATWTAPATAQTVTITATSVDDPSKTATTTVTVIAAPVATSLVSSNATPTSGATFTLTPTYSGGTGVLDNGVSCPATGVASGLISANWTGARTYTLTVTNALGAVATATVTVTPVPPFAIESFTSNLDLVSFGGSATLSWVLSGPTPTALTLDGASVLGSLSAAVAPRNRQTFTLAGTSGNTDTKTARVGAQGLDLLAGNPGGYGNADGTGPTARFSSPRSVAVDADGNTYVADGSNHTIRKISPSGVVSTLAGLAGALGSIDGTGTEARFNNPQGVAVDAGGNVYVADSSNHTIRKITPAGLVSTLAGQAGAWGSTDGTSGDPTTARFKQPAAVAVDAAGNIYVADSNNHTIRQITPAGVVSTLAGLALTSGTTNGTGSLARFNVPYGVAVDKDGYVYVADRNNHTIRKITISAGVGAVSTLAGQAGTSGFTDGTATAASFYMPSGVAVDADRNIYVVCANTIRKITSSDVVSTFAGWVGTSGSTDATGTAARFNAPSGVAVDASGYVYVADTTNNTIRKITPGGVVNTLAGLAVQQGAADGLGTAAQFYNARGVAVDKDGNAYVGDTSNHTIRKITPAGVVSTLAGLAGNPGSTDGTGSLARFSSPWGVAVDATGNVYVADKFNYTLRKITPAGVVTTLAGLAGNPGSADGTGAAAQFFAPLGVAVDTAGNVYVADNNNHTIRKITPAGEVTTLAGLAGTWGSADGTGTSAKFKYPSAVAVDTGGYVYVADQSNYTIRMITPGGVVSTLAGLAGTPGSADGTGTAARFNTPWGVAVDAGGNVYVADVNNYSIRKVTSAGVVTTVVGRVGVVGFQPGPLPGVLGSPSGVALTPDGDLVIVMSNAVVQVTAP